MNNSVKFMTLTHANTGQPVQVVVGLIFAFWYSETHKSTIVLANGGAMFPVIETPELISTKMQS